MISFDGSTNELHELLLQELASLTDADRVIREMLAQSRGALWIGEPKSNRIIYCSPAWSAIWGRPVSERPTTVDAHLANVHPEDRARNELVIRELGGEPVTHEYRILRPDGTERWVRDTLFRLAGSGGDAERYAGFIEDITEERAAGEARARSERLFSTITANSHTMMVLADEHGTIRFATEASLPLLGYTREETLGRTAADFVHPEDLPAVLEALQRCVAEPGHLAQVEARMRCKDGGTRIAQLSGTNLLHEPAVRSVVVTMHDVTDLRQREEELRTSQGRLRTVLDSLHAFVGLLTPEGELMFVNRAALDCIGHADDTALVGRHFADTPYWTDPASRDALLRAISAARDGRAARLDVKHHDATGRELIVDFMLTPVKDPTGRVLYLVPAGIDVTAREEAAAALRQKEQELRQVQKMEAVGRLAGGVAHDFNNIITAVMAFSDILLTDLPHDSPSRSDAEEIRRAADRAQALTRQLLAFSRHQIMEPQPFVVCHRVKGMLGMLKRLVGEDVLLDVSCDESGPKVFADPGQIEQVVLNLAVNARDAMPHGGRLDISVGTVRNVAGEAQWVRMKVSDTGCGMPSEVMEHVFEPFFTTKPLGQGTGLGLSTVYGIVKQSGGFIEIESEVGTGTTFTITLPAWVGDLPATEPAEIPEIASLAGEIALLVEDDETVRSVTRRVLERAHLRVIEATNGREGLERLAEHPEVGLVITDIVMPRMSGLEMLSRMRQEGLIPAVLVTSGYTEETLANHGNVPADARYLDKPFTAEALLEAARAAIQAHRATGEFQAVAPSVGGPGGTLMNAEMLGAGER